MTWKNIYLVWPLVKTGVTCHQNTSSLRQTTYTTSGMNSPETRLSLKARVFRIFMLQVARHILAWTTFWLWKVHCGVLQQTDLLFLDHIMILYITLQVSLSVWTLNWSTAFHHEVLHPIVQKGAKGLLTEGHELTSNHNIQKLNTSQHTLRAH